MLKWIEAKNFKSLKHIDFKCAGLNLLMGLNGAGKSSFVQLMLFLRSIAGKSHMASITVPVSVCGEDVGTYADLKYCYAKDSSPISFVVEFEVDGCAASDIVSHGNGVTAGCICRVIRQGNSKKEIVIENSEWYGRSIEEIRRSFKEEGVETFCEKNPSFVSELRSVRAYKSIWKNAKYVSSFRERPIDIHQGRLLNASKMLEDGNVTVKSDGSDIAEFLYKFGKTVEVEDGRSPSRFSDRIYPGSAGNDENGKLRGVTLMEQVCAWLNVISPGAKVCLDMQEASDKEKYFMSVSFDDLTDVGHKFKPQNVGFGIGYVLPVLVALLSANPGEVVIIENPEAHLHPKGQAKMGELIARAAASGIQLFVETHSDHVVNGIRSAVKDGIVKPKDVNIAFFERREHDVANEEGKTHQEIYSEVRNIRVDKNGSLSEYPDGFLDEWNNQLMELL